MLNWWHAVPISFAITGFVLCAMGLYWFPNAIVQHPEDMPRARRWGWLVTALVFVGISLLMTAGPLLWLPIWYG